MKRVLAFFLVAGSVAAAPKFMNGASVNGTNTGGNVVTATTGALVGCVDGVAGNDSNSCVTAGTSCSSTTPACATPQGALNKAPKHLDHALNIYVDGGSYPGFFVSGFTYDPSVQQNSGWITIQGGALANSTLASGSPTGTVSSSTAGSNGTFGTITDGSATFTTGDLIGKFFVMTSGPNSGYTKPIFANTGTVITVADIGNAALSGTYAIQEPTTRITTPVLRPPFGAFNLKYAGIAYVGAPGLVLQLTNIGVSVTSTPYGIIHQGSGRLSLTKSVVYAGPTTGNLVMDPQQPGASVVTNSFVSLSTSVDNHFNQFTSDPDTPFYNVAFNNTVFSGGTNGVQTSNAGVTAQYLGVTGVTEMGILLPGYSQWRPAIALNITCSTSPTPNVIGVGLGAVVDGELDDDALIYGHPAFSIASGVINNCGTAVAIAGPGSASLAAVQGTVGYGVFATNGGRAYVTRGRYAFDAGVDIAIERGTANAGAITAMLTDIPDGGCITSSSGAGMCERLFQSGAGWHP